MDSLNATWKAERTILPGFAAITSLRLAESLGCDKKDTYAAGDGYNDVEMLIAANAGFVPENGSKEALSVAKYVTRSNNNGCIAHAIEILDNIY